MIEQTDIDYLCHSKICAKSRFCGLFILLLDTAFKSPNVKLENTVYRKCPNSVNYQSSIFALKAKNYIIFYFVYDSYSFVTNSLLGLMSLAKCLRLKTYCVSFTS